MYKKTRRQMKVMKGGQLPRQGAFPPGLLEASLHRARFPSAAKKYEFLILVIATFTVNSGLADLLQYFTRLVIGTK